MGVSGEDLQLMQFKKAILYYYKSHENPYQYYKSRENLYQYSSHAKICISTKSHVRICNRYCKSRVVPNYTGKYHSFVAVGMCCALVTIRMETNS